MCRHWIGRYFNWHIQYLWQHSTENSWKPDHGFHIALILYLLFCALVHFFHSVSILTFDRTNVRWTFVCEIAEYIYSVYILHAKSMSMPKITEKMLVPICITKWRHSKNKTMIFSKTTYSRTQIKSDMTAYLVGQHFAYKQRHGLCIFVYAISLHCRPFRSIPSVS